MPGRFYLTDGPEVLAAYFGAAAPDFVDGPRLNISPGQQITVCLPDRTLVQMRWGMIPVGRVNARGRPVMDTIVNARSETVFDKSAFADVGRCIVPANGWYEWTRERRKKTAWRIRPRTDGLLAFAAVYDVWKAPGGSKVAQAATVTCEPSDDVKHIHDRMGVILDPDDFETWLTDDTESASALTRPLRAKSLVVEEATGIDWAAG